MAGIVAGVAVTVAVATVIVVVVTNIVAVVVGIVAGVAGIAAVSALVVAVIGCRHRLPSQVAAVSDISGLAVGVTVIVDRVLS